MSPLVLGWHDVSGRRAKRAVRVRLANIFFFFFLYCKHKDILTTETYITYKH